MQFQRLRTPSCTTFTRHSDMYTPLSPVAVGRMLPTSMRAFPHAHRALLRPCSAAISRRSIGSSAPAKIMTATKNNEKSPLGAGTEGPHISMFLFWVHVVVQ